MENMTSHPKQPDGLREERDGEPVHHDLKTWVAVTVGDALAIDIAFLEAELEAGR